MIIEHNGKKKTSRQWAKEVGLTESVVLNRIAKGWTLERALTEGKDAYRLTSRSVFERIIDDTPVEKLPADLQELLREGDANLAKQNRKISGTNKGDWIRRNYPNSFNRHHREYMEKNK